MIQESACKSVYENCHFAVECEKHRQAKDAFCEVCLDHLTSGNLEAGRRSYVLLTVLRFTVKHKCTEL